MADENFNILSEIEADERWLAHRGAQGVPAANLSSIKAAIRTELGSGRREARASRWRPWQGVVATAAMLALCVGIVRYASLVAPSSGERTESQWVAAVMERETVQTIDDEQLEDLESLSINESWALSGVSMYEAFEEAFNETDGNDESGEAGALGPRAPTNEAVG